MLTPMDIQQKKFHAGLGFDKKDVVAFFQEVAKDYETLFRKNAELTEEVNALSDRLQNYKSKEAELEKNLMTAEKESADRKSKASREARNIELDAKNKAKVIVQDAEARLEQMQDEMTELSTMYAAYKSNFASLLKMQLEDLEENDFDVDAYIDDRAWSAIGGGGGNGKGQPADDGSFGTFGGDPQMRDPSMGGLGSGISSAQMGGGFGDTNPTTSTSAVYTSGLSANENFVDPFSPKKDDGRYNPYDGSKPKPKAKPKQAAKPKPKTTTASQASGTTSSGTKTTFKYADASKKDAESISGKNAPPKPKIIKPTIPEDKPKKQKVEEPEVEEMTDEVMTEEQTVAPEVKEAPEEKAAPEPESAPIPEIKTVEEPVEEPAEEPAAKTTFEKPKSVDEIADDIIIEDEEESLVGDVEEKASDFARLSDDTDDDEDDGFEFF